MRGTNGASPNTTRDRPARLRNGRLATSNAQSSHYPYYRMTAPRGWMRTGHLSRPILRFLRVWAVQAIRSLLLSHNRYSPFAYSRSVSCLTGRHQTMADCPIAIRGKDMSMGRRQWN
jgi:hypothetical protein